MKKKIVAACATVALAAVALGGATLAYFTDQDQAKNTFSVGSVDVSLTETAEVKDAQGNDVSTNTVAANGNGGYIFRNLMPSYAVTKAPLVKNSGTSAAYVRVAVVLNNVYETNQAIDGVYESKISPETNEIYTANEIQDIYDYIFAGWGVNYNKRNVDGNNDRRMWMDDRTGENSPVLWNIDMYCRQPANGSMYDVNNYFKSGTDTNEEGFDYANNGYYRNATKEGSEERVYVFYLKLEAGASYKLFDGLNIPADFTNAQMAMFDGLEIGVYADAIQTVGFAGTNEGAKQAFETLEAEHPLGWWNQTSGK